MAFQIYPSIPLQAQRTTFDPASILMQAQTNAANLEKHRFEMQKLREDYDLAKEKRKQEKAMQMGIASDLAGIQSGSPAQYAPTRFEQTPQRGQMPQGMTGVLRSEQGQQMPQPQAFGEEILNGDFRLGGGEVTQEAVAGREPTYPEMLAIGLKQAMLTKNQDEIFKYAKAIQEAEKQSVKFGMNPTKGINPQTMQPDYFVVNELGQKQFLGVNPYETPKEAKTSLVKTSKGFEVVRDGELPKGAPVETQPRQPRLQQVTDENGTYLLDIDTGETKPVIVGGKQLKPAAPIKDPSGEESKSAGYAFRMNQANKIITDFESTNKGLPTYAPSIAGSIPFVGDYLERKTQNSDQQLYKNAALAWLRAKLRDESGATIQNLESSNEYKTYFPVVGDEPETIKQKAYLRDIAEREMILKSGKAVNKLNEAKAKKDKEEYLFERAKALKAGNKKLVETLDAKANEMGMI
jgi:hypothetical protein